MLKKTLEKQREYINYYFDQIDPNEIQTLVDQILNCKGIVFFTGIGKSGLVAKKIALTMVSTGTKAIYLSPTDALHGDIGMVNADDLFIVLSKSGESDEVLALLPAIKNKGASLLAIVCNPKSRLSAICHKTITIPFKHELCPFDMAPTISTTLQMMLGDSLTVALMEAKQFTLDDYALNHPSGRLGRRITLKVKDLMIKDENIPLCYSNTKIKDALIELSNKRCGAVVVVDAEKRLLGVFTDGDLRRALQKRAELDKGAEEFQSSQNFFDTTIDTIMTVNPRFTTPEVLAWDAMKIMESNYQRRISILPVLDQHHVVLGLLHLHDIIQVGL